MDKQGWKTGVLLLVWVLITALCALNVLKSHLNTSTTWILWGVLSVVALLHRPLAPYVERIAKLKWVGILPALLSFGVCAWLARSMFGAAPRVQDEVNYFYLSKLLASGRLYVETPIAIDFLNYRFFVPTDRYYSLFQAGWPTLMAPFQWIRQPWLANPLMSGIAVGLAHATLRRCFGAVFALVCAMLIAMSMAWWIQGASMMSHMSATTLLLLAIYAGARWDEAPERKRWLVLCGAAFGWMFTIRAATAVSMSIPWILAGLWRIRQQQRSWKDIVWFGAGITPVGSLQLLYNFVLTGHLLTFPQTIYFAMTEPLKNCHTLGIGAGIGCPFEHGPDLGRSGFTWARAAEVTGIRLTQFRWDLFGLGMPIWFAPLILFVKAPVIKRVLVLSMPLSLILIYFFYYYHGNLYGARYYFEGLLFVLVAAMLGVKAIYDHIEHDRVPGWGQWVLRSVLIGMCLMWPAFHLMTSGPKQRAMYNNGWRLQKQLARAAKASSLRNAVVIVPNGSRNYWPGFANNNATFDGDVIFVRDWGMAMNASLWAMYPDRKIYRVQRRRGEVRFVPARLYGDGERFVFEGEAKFPPIRRHKGYAQPQSLRAWKHVRASGGAHLFFHKTGKGSWFEMRHYVPKTCSYLMDARLTQAPDYAQVRLSVDGQPVGGVFDGYAPKVRVASWSSEQPVELTKGWHTIRLEIVGRHASSKGWFAGLDRVQLRCQK